MLLTKTQLNQASVKELQQAAASINAEIAKRDSSAKTDLLKKVKKLAADAGVTIEELLGKPAKAAKAASAGKSARAKKSTVKKSRGKVAAKYANPANSAQTWTGRGRKPLWVAACLDSGKSLESLTIK